MSIYYKYLLGNKKFRPQLWWVILVIFTSGGARNLPSPCFLLEMSSIGLPVTEKSRPARRINDLIFFDGRLYLGCGDAVEDTGPTDIIYYDFKSKKFITGFTVDEEAIYHFEVVDKKLMIPGVDATEDWSFGNFYVLTDTGWIKQRTIPNGIHVSSIVRFKKKLYASAGSFAELNKKNKIYFGAVFSSTDWGVSWNISYATRGDDQHVFRIEDLIVYKDKLYAFPYAYSGLKREEIPERYHPSLGEPYEEGYYLILANDCLGPGDVLINDGRSWYCENLINEAQLAWVKKPFVFCDKLVMPTLFGEYIDYLSLMDNLPKNGMTKILSYDGKHIRELNFRYDIIIDHLIKEENLYLLIKRDNLFYIAETKDLKHWKYFLIPPVIKNPLSIEFKANKFYVGAEDGNIFESINTKEVKNFAAAENLIPKKIFSIKTEPEDSGWYWVAITKRQSQARVGKISGEVRFGNIIKITTENIDEFSIYLPFYYLNPNWGIMLIIDNRVVYDGKINDAKKVSCKKREKNGKIYWEAKNLDF